MLNEHWLCREKKELQHSTVKYITASMKIRVCNINRFIHNMTKWPDDDRNDVKNATNKFQILSTVRHEYNGNTHVLCSKPNGLSVLIIVNWNRLNCELIALFQFGVVSIFANPNWMQQYIFPIEIEIHGDLVRLIHVSTLFCCDDKCMALASLVRQQWYQQK